MKKIKVNLGQRSYQILIGPGLLAKLSQQLKTLQPAKVAIVVTNPTISRLHGGLIQAALRDSGLEIHLAEVPDSEQSKSAQQCLELIAKFADLDRGKGIVVIAFGGGVIGDLAGFAASVYRRGVPLIQVPTTLLAQVDSSIGGKVAIDLACGKNLVGSFYQPQMVLSDTDLLKSLQPEQIKQSLAEIIKYGVIDDARLFSFLEGHLEEIFQLKLEILQHVVEVCSAIKAGIVRQDETEQKGKRTILNFGHTTAHALEAASGYSADYAHGAAVALGMLVACEIATQLKLVAPASVSRIEALIKKCGLPTKITGLNLDNISKAQAHDKKFTAGKNRFVLPVRIGKVVVKEDIPQEIITQAIKSRM